MSTHSDQDGCFFMAMLTGMCVAVVIVGLVGAHVEGRKRGHEEMCRVHCGPYYEVKYPDPNVFQPLCICLQEKSP